MSDPSNPGQFLESRLSADMFRRFEPLLAKALQAFPDETSFTIPPDCGMSPTTFLARFRDARLSYLKFNWPSTLITPELREKLISIQGSHTISLDPVTGLVWFRQKHRKGRPKELIVDAMTHLSHSSAPTDRVWPTWTTEELRAICLLLSTKKATGPIILKGPSIDPALEADLLINFDVSLVRNEDVQETVIM